MPSSEYFTSWIEPQSISLCSLPFTVDEFHLPLLSILFIFPLTEHWTWQTHRGVHLVLFFGNYFNKNQPEKHDGHNLYHYLQWSFKRKKEKELENDQMDRSHVPEGLLLMHHSESVEGQKTREILHKCKIIFCHFFLFSTVFLISRQNFNSLQYITLKNT